MNNNEEKLKDKILSFYDYEVDDQYAERVVEFAKNKLKAFNWLFKDSQRIELSISDEEAAEYFYSNNYAFSKLYDLTKKFFQLQNLEIMQNLKLAIFKNRILYQKNTYKFSKFYRLFLCEKDTSKAINIQQFYDKLKTANCMISIHPMDFISASERCSYNSCYAIESCHHTGCTAYLRDNITIMVYTRMGERKIGRQWIYFNNYYIVFGRIYGAISLPLQDKIRAFIEQKYAEYKNISNTWILKKDYDIEEHHLENCGHSSNDHEEYSVYFDQQVSAIVRHKQETENFNGLYLTFEDGLDKDGYDTSDGKLFTTCCVCCEERIDGEGNSTNDGVVCDDCLNSNYTYCEDCETYYHSDSQDMYFIEGEDIHLCETCYDQGDYFYCEKTEQYWSTDQKVELTLYNGSRIEVSRDWANDNAYFCHYCETCHEEPLEIVDDEYICEDCLEEYYVEIDGEYYSKADQVA